MSAQIRQAIAAHRDAMVDLTRELVAIPTENPPGSRYGDAIQVLRRRLGELGFTDTQVEGDCVLSYIGAGDRTLYFSGHYDVVPAQDPAQFSPSVKGANLFGRGSSDMKSGLAAMIYAARALADRGAVTKGRIGLVFVPDEETAGPRGSRYLDERGLLGGNAVGMLTPEPTGGVVWNANRGAITLRVTVKGKPAHVGRQHEGVNAFDGMLRVAQALTLLKSEVETRSTAFQIAPAAARRSILMLGGRIEGGTNFNVVPERCSFTIDRRINPEEDFDREKQRLFGVLEQARAGGIDLEVETLQEGRSCGVAADGQVGQALARSIQQVTGKPAPFELCPGLLEIRFYAQRGIPAFAYGPGLLSVSHGPNEFVPVDRIVDCAQVYALTALELLGDRGQ
jgi:acetylornithine deacetylase/succinyl-diaminopimelate desuccinylase family protein